MSVSKVFGIVLSLCMVGACAAPQSGGTGPSASANQSGGAAAGLNINVSNTIVRVAELDDEGRLRRELEEFKSGLYWSRGARPTDAVIEIAGKDDVLTSTVTTPSASDFGQTVLFGTVSLVDAATGDVVVAPISIRVAIGDDRDARNIGLTNGTKRSVELEYLVQKFIFESREALYGPGR